MDINQLKKHWNRFGKIDPLWAIQTKDDKKGNKWDADEFFLTGKEEIARILEYLRSMGIELRRGRALDFGCGVGRLTQALASQFLEVCGVDIAPSMIRRARRYNRYGNCKYYLNSRPDLKLFSDARFDFIYTSLTLQHMEPRYIKAYLAEFLRLLVPDGILVFNLPSERVPPAGTRGEETEPNKGRAVVITTANEERHNGSVARIKRLIKLLTPKPILDFYTELRYPVMEMHTMKREEVEGFLQLKEGRMLDAVQIKLAPSWVGYRYCLTKSSSSKST